MSTQTNHDRHAWIRRGLFACLVGSGISLVGFNPLLFPVLNDGVGGSSTRAEQALAIAADFTQWRLTWLISMPARIAIGVGLWLLAMGLAAREHGQRATAARVAAWAAVINVPLGIARFGITFGDADYAADPGLWFDLLWGAHWAGTIIAALVIVWLTYGTISPRWAAIVLALAAALGTVLVAAPPIYQGLGIYAAAALWRQRHRSNEHRSGDRADLGATAPKSQEAQR